MPASRAALTAAWAAFVAVPARAKNALEDAGNVPALLKSGAQRG